jgi:hypothetical protein
MVARVSASGIAPLGIFIGVAVAKVKRLKVASGDRDRLSAQEVNINTGLMDFNLWSCRTPVIIRGGGEVAYRINCRLVAYP